MKSFALGLILCALAPCAAHAFTMDDVLSAPYLSNLVASSDGRAIAWAVHVRGVRNIYAYAGGSIEQVTHYATDDGQQVSALQFLPQNDAIVYVHGGEDGNIGDENPNPMALAAPPDREIDLVPLSGGAPQKIGVGHTPRVSPKGDLVVWVSHGALQSAALSRAASGTYTIKTMPPPFHVAGVRHVTFAPDGSRIAFVSGRGDHGFIGIYRFGDTAVRYAKPDFTNDTYPAWSPDGSKIAFVRAPGYHEEQSPYDASPLQSWSIWIADPQTGGAHKIWQARRGMGAAFYPSPESDAQLWWLENNRIAFPWEGDGWEHLYTIGATGGAPKNLTPGTFEVERITPTVDGNAFVIASNRGAIDARHISRVDTAGHLTQLTQGPHNQWSPVALADGKLAYIDAGYKDVATLVDTAAASQRLTAVATPSTFPASALIEPKLITFRAPDGLLVHAQLFAPRDGGRTHPAIVFDHGGPERQMLAGFHYMEAYTNLYESNQYYANHGFVVLSINYRSGIMYGHAFREAKHVGPLGAAEYYKDVLSGANYLMHRPDVNPNRIGIYGLSYGGYLTAMGLAHNSEIFKAGADFAGVHNWATLLDADVGQRAGTPAQRYLAVANSPIAAINTWRSPLFLSQGDDDRNVAFSQGVDLAWRLRERNIPVETMVFPNETHENLVYAHMLKLFQAAADFMGSHLKR